jgi:hypothetical protein
VANRRPRTTGSASSSADRGRWSSRRKLEVVLRLLRGEDLDTLSRELGVTAAAMARWREQFLASGQAGLRSRKADERDEQIGRMKAKIGEITMANELLRERARRAEANHPFVVAEAEAVGQSSSPSAGRPYRLAFTCRVLELPRSSVYAARARARAPAATPGKRGPDALQSAGSAVETDGLGTVPVSASPRAPRIASPTPSDGGDRHWATFPPRRMAPRGIALIGLACIVAAEALSAGPVQDALATSGVIALAITAILALVGGSTFGPESSRRRFSRTVAPASKIAWRWTLFGLGCTGVLVAQTWFQTGTAIAGGDLTPPVGTAWLGTLFSTFAWSGSNLGGPAQVQEQLPWAAVTWIVHLAGGSGALAQRMWLSALLAGVLVAAAALVRALGLSPAAGVAAALAYAFNPYVLSVVGSNEVYLIAMILLAALPAVLLAAGSGRLRTWQAVMALIIAAPFVGYAYENPPLVGMIAGAVLITPLVAWLSFGRAAASRSLRALLVSGAVLVGACAYWVVPASVSLVSAATGQLSPLSAWTWTEGRATLANALWLNTSWGWNFSYYYPYAADFARLPLALLRPLLPLVAFGGLALRPPPGAIGRQLVRLRGAIIIAVLGILVLSTGTRPPGNILFDPLYGLPYGWLLREPGRFLMVAALGFALLAAVLVDHLILVSHVPSLPVLVRGRGALRRAVAPGLALTAVIATALAVFPLWTGAVIAGPVDGFPSEHVRIPSYWLATARYLNTAAPAGTVLVLPADDFYQMPYPWYYGDDDFIPNLLDRHVLVPSGQGYYPASTELLAAVQLESAALLASDWGEARRLMEALGAPVVLLRGDIEADFPGRDIVAPAVLEARLRADPLMRILHQDGPLGTYELRTPITVPRGFATVDTATPDLRALSLLPSGWALVSSPPIAGHLSIYQVASVSTWQLSPSSLTTTVREPPGWTYSAAVLGLQRGGDSLARNGVHTNQVPAPAGGHLMEIQVPVGPSLIRDGNFASGLWGPVGNCNDLHPVHPPEVLSAAVLTHAGPDGDPALQLSATIDAACESTALAWHGGAFLLDLSTRSLAGAPTRLCVWETPSDRCATTAALPTSSRWQRYRTVVTPDPGAETLSLFLYADVYPTGQRSVEQYAHVIVRSLPAAPKVDVVGRPVVPPAPTRLLSLATGFAPGWVGPSGAAHVEVDGMRNGWLSDTTAVTAGQVRYLPGSGELRDEILLAGGSLLAAIAIAAGAAFWRRRSST